MSKAKICLVGLLLVVLAADVLSAGISTQIREGVYKEEVEGDLDAAMKIYEQIIAEHTENQSYAAQATYRLGLCYLKKGQKDKAIEQYERIIKHYPAQESILEKARMQLEELKPAFKMPEYLDNDDFRYKIMPAIGGLYREYRSEAKSAGLHLNCQLYGVDETFTFYNGGLITLENNTSNEWSENVHLMNSSGSNHHFFDEQGNLLKNVKTKDRGIETGRYSYFWNPPFPIKPGQSRTLQWGIGIQKLNKDAENRYPMQMNNHYGNEVLECFFLVLPEKLVIFNSSRDYTLKKTVVGHDIYIYKRNVPPNTTNKVYLTIGFGDEEKSEDNRPTVIKSVPATYANDVSPDLNKISVTFNQPMKDGCWSWVKWNYKYPETTGKPYYDKKGTTCTLPVKLEPGTAYLIRINAEKYSSFMNTDGVKAKPFVLVFATKDKDGKPTPIPDEMLEFAKYINQNNSAYNTASNWREIVLPDKALFTDDKAPLALDLKSGSMISGGTDVQYYNNHDKGDIAYIFAYVEGLDILICLRGGKITRDGLDKADQSDKENNTNFYIIKKTPVNWIVTTKEGNQYELEILSLDNKQAKIRYRNLPDAAVDNSKSKANLFAEIDYQVTRFIGEQFGKIAQEANEKHLAVNSQIYYVDTDGDLYSGGMNSFYNWTGKTIKGKTRFGGTGFPNQTLYGIDGQELKTEIVQNKARRFHWHIYWIPDEPLAPGESLYYGWSLDNKIKLPQLNNEYMLIMQNNYGMSVIETFFLVLPKDLHISQSSKPTGSEELLNCNVYWWTKTVKQGENNIENLRIAKDDAKPKTKAEKLCAEGWELFQQRKLDQSEAKFTEAASLDSSNDNALQGLGWAQFNKGKNVNAKNSFEKCIKLNPNNSAALNGLGWIAYGEDKKDEAIQWWEKAVKAAPGATASLNGLCKVYMERKDYQKAIKYYKMWLEVEPNNMEARGGKEIVEGLLQM